MTEEQVAPPTADELTAAIEDLTAQHTETISQQHIRKNHIKQAEAILTNQAGDIEAVAAATADIERLRAEEPELVSQQNELFNQREGLKQQLRNLQAS